MREGGSGSGGREGRLRKGTSKEWMDGVMFPFHDVITFELKYDYPSNDQ